MKRVKLETAPPSVQEFFHALPLEEGVEFEAKGQVIGKFLPASLFSVAEKKALVEERWRLIQQAEVRTKDVPARVIDREIDEAVDEVRGRQHP